MPVCPRSDHQWSCQNCTRDASRFDAQSDSGGSGVGLGRSQDRGLGTNSNDCRQLDVQLPATVFAIRMAEPAPTPRGGGPLDEATTGKGGVAGTADRRTIGRKPAEGGNRASPASTG